jgi:hypothetical protein
MSSLSEPTFIPVAPDSKVGRCTNPACRATGWISNFVRDGGCHICGSLSEPRYLSRAIECPVCEKPVHDGDHEALFTRDDDGIEHYVMTGHRSCITAEVERLNGEQR